WEMIKTAIENDQNLIVEGCYIPLDWKKDFEKEYLENIRSYLLIMSREYILEHFSEIKKYASVIEKRLFDDFTLEEALQENEKLLSLAEKQNLEYILIHNKYEIQI
ncbi:MAG: adenylate kinase, partial [Clostridia bacterium]|nr:adenylate kinase [Clostridia bacterium]